MKKLDTKTTFSVVLTGIMTGMALYYNFTLTCQFLACLFVSTVVVIGLFSD